MFHQREGARDEVFLNPIFLNWESIAAFAYDCYLHCGRGIVTMNEMALLSGSPDGKFLPIGDLENGEAGGWGCITLVDTLT